MTDRPDLEAPDNRPTFVYFARGLKTGLIKIGHSFNPTKRASATVREHGEGVTILFTIPGPRKKEADFHKRFKEYRAKAEWFHEGATLHTFLGKRGCAGELYIKQPPPDPETPPPALPLKPLKPTKYVPEPNPRPMKVGYARVSTADQSLDMQVAMLTKEGCERIFVEKLSATNAKRPEFHLLMKFLMQDDTLIVYSVSRLARDVRKLYEIVDELKREGVTLRSITEPHMDTSTAEGRLMFTVKGAIDQFEREQTRTRTIHGLAEKKRQGMYLGAPRKVDDKQIREMKKLRKTMKVTEIAKRFHIKPATVYAHTGKKKKD